MHGFPVVWVLFHCLYMRSPMRATEHAISWAIHVLSYASNRTCYVFHGLYMCCPMRVKEHEQVPKLAGTASIIGDTYIANALVASYCMYSTWSVVGCGSGIHQAIVAVLYLTSSRGQG